MTRIIPLATLALMLSPAAVPAEKPREKKPVSQPAARAAKSRLARRAAAGSGLSELLAKDFTVPGKESKSFDAQADFTGAQFVSIAVEAPGESDIGTEKFRIIVWWGMPGADWYTAQDVLSGQDFYFANQGGAVVPVYGPDLRIEVVNDSESPVSINQLTIYAVTG